MNSIFDSQDFNQNLFFPRPDYGSTPPGKEDSFVEVDDRINIHIRRHPAPSATVSVVYFHGNGEIVSDYNDLEAAYSSISCELIVCDYRGYGQSNGIPTLRKALADSHKIYKFLKDSGKLLDTAVVMGRSLGSASAIELCSEYREIDGCVIESGYADPIPLVERRGLKIDSTTPEEDALFNNSQKISKVTCPLLIMHGADDWLIYPKEAEMNFANAGSKNKNLEILTGVGHNDIMLSRDYFPCLKKFIDSIK